MSRWLIVGLGNPGKKYEGTRHNVGFDGIRGLAARQGLQIDRAKFKGFIATGSVAGRDVVFLIPQTFMNRSGGAVLAARQFYGIEARETIVFHDDIDLEPGRMKLKQGGGHGGHNGLRDIIARTGERDFFRVRLGVGRPARGEVTAHVLGRFGKEERPVVEEMIEDGCDAVEMLLDEGLEAAQNRFH